MDPKTKAIIDMLQEQRNNALNRCALLAGELAAALEKIKLLEDEKEKK